LNSTQPLRPISIFVHQPLPPFPSCIAFKQIRQWPRPILLNYIKDLGRISRTGIQIGWK